MERFSIEVCGATCIIDSDRKLKLFFEDNMDYIVFQGLKIQNDIDGVIHRLKYRDCVKGKESVVCDDFLIDIRYPSEQLDDQNIAYVSRFLIEKQLAETGKATCHSACVERDGKAVLLLGEAGAGKTSVSVNLCKNYGYKLISNDQTVIGLENGRLMAFGGTKFLNLRLLSVKENMPYLLGLFDKTDVNEWTYKVKVLANEIGIEEQYEATEIDKILVLHCNNNYKEIIIGNGDTWRNNFTLYQNLTFNISNCASPIVNKYGHPIGFVPSYDTLETFNKRVELINFINSHSGYKSVSGNIEGIQKEIVGRRR